MINRNQPLGRKVHPAIHPEPQPPARRIIRISVHINTHYYPEEIAEAVHKALEQADIEVLRVRAVFGKPLADSGKERGCVPPQAEKDSTHET